MDQVSHQKDAEKTPKRRQKEAEKKPKRRPEWIEYAIGVASLLQSGSVVFWSRLTDTWKGADGWRVASPQVRVFTFALVVLCRLLNVTSCRAHRALAILCDEAGILIDRAGSDLTCFVLFCFVFFFVLFGNDLV